MKHELFDRRYAQYEAVQNFIAETLKNGKPSDESQIEYRRGISGIEFTYDEDIAKYLHEKIWCTAVDLECKCAEMEDIPQSEERRKLAKERGALKIKLIDESGELYKRFKPYLNLKH